MVRNALGGVIVLIGILAALYAIWDFRAVIDGVWLYLIFCIGYWLGWYVKGNGKPINDDVTYEYGIDGITFDEQMGNELMTEPGYA